MKNNTRRIYSEAEAEALRASYKWSAGVLQHEFDQETIDHCQAEIQAGIERIIRGESTKQEEYQRRLDQHVKKLKELSNQNRMQENIKNNAVLGTPNSDISAVNAEVHISCLRSCLFTSLTTHGHLYKSSWVQRVNQVLPSTPCLNKSLFKMSLLKN
ncbi:hypothetical protein [Acinetobacter guillouiae]|uniref:hypothetical protein n=1 Tax=Acinetobacter guillouiae TaxID=106649 RepID=UPI0026E378ED|nr:hypothetical protein [Acinetobacter guillouiae]MDO6646498.1 hypothetical protein [Acinetobacter guillouiae]